MASSYTANKTLEKPANGDQVDTWNVPVNADWDIIDQAFGGVTSLNATSGSATLTVAQYRSLSLSVSGAMSANVTYTLPIVSGGLVAGGQWIVNNTTTDGSGGPWTVTIASAAGGTSVVIPRNKPLIISSDGTNIRSVYAEAVTSTPAFPSGTIMLFVQTSAPTGWTKSTTHDNKALRIVSGAASSGGSVAFTTAFASQSVAGTVGSTTLTTSQIPSHSHTTLSDLYGVSGGGAQVLTSISGTSGSRSGVTAVEGGGLGHTHTFTGTAINLAVQYVDVIICVKD